MALQILNRSATGFRYGEIINGVFIGITIRGSGLTYGSNGLPDGGLINAMTFASCNVLTNGAQNSVERLTLPAVLVSELNGYGFDWFAGATSAEGVVTTSIDTLLANIDGLRLASPQATSQGTPQYHLIGGANGDVLVVPTNTTALSVIDGGAGNDTITASGLWPEIHGGDGNDRITASGQLVVVSGDAGDDAIKVTANSQGNVSGGTGNDTVAATYAQSLFVDGGSGDDRITLTYSGNGNSPLASVYGGDGNDTITGAREGEQLSGGTGNDLIRSGDASTSDGPYFTGMRGDAGDDRLIGGLGRQYLSGDDGNDTISGGGGDDVIAGGAGNDRLVGDAGRDQIFLGAGIDRATGGADGDVFIFTNSDGQPGPSTTTITDFATSDDLLMLDTASDLNAVESYDAFIAHAQQNGAHVLYFDGVDRTIILSNVALSSLTAQNFSDDTILLFGGV